jgi:hypothetical protein
MAFAAPAGADENDWTSTSSFDGSCLAPLICPTVTNAFVPLGGADGDGYISTVFTGVAGVSVVAGTSTSIWESPPFVYGGGSSNARLLTMNRRASVDQLLAVEGNSAEYWVQLSNVSAGGAGPTVIGPATLAGADTWRPVPAAAIKPAQLTPGDTYKILIGTRYTTGTSVLVTGSADYDNIGLRPAGSSDSGNGTGNGKGNGSSMSSDRLLSLFQSGMAGTAVLKGNRLLVKVNCPKTIGGSCRITAQGLLKKGKPATTKRTVKVRSGKGKRVVLKVKPKFRAKLARRKRLLVSEKVRAGKATATAYKVRKLIRKR